MDERQAARERLEEARRTSSRRRAELEEAQRKVQRAAVFGTADEVERAQGGLESAQGAYDAAVMVEDELLLKHVEILHQDKTSENPPRLAGRYHRERYTGERYKVTELEGERLKVGEPVVEAFLDDQKAWEKEFKASDQALRRQSEGIRRSKKDKKERAAREKQAEREKKRAAAAEKRAAEEAKRVAKAEKAAKAKPAAKPARPKAAKVAKAARPRPKARPAPAAKAMVPVKSGQTAVRATLYQLEPGQKVPEQDQGVLLRIRWKGEPVLVGLPVEHIKVGALVVHPELGQIRSYEGGGLTAVVGPRYQVSLASDGVTLDGSWPYESAAVAAVQAADEEAGPVDWTKVRVIEGRVRWSSSAAEARAKAWMKALQGARPRAVVVTHQQLAGTAAAPRAKAPKARPKARAKVPRPSAKAPRPSAKAPKDAAPERHAERLDAEDAEMMEELRKLLREPGVIDVVKQAAAAAAGPEPETQRRANPGAT